MTSQLLHAEFPYIWGKFDFLFYQCSDRKINYFWNFKTIYQQIQQSVFEKLWAKIKNINIPCFLFYICVVFAELHRIRKQNSQKCRNKCCLLWHSWGEGHTVQCSLCVLFSLEKDLKVINAQYTDSLRVMNDFRGPGFFAVVWFRSFPISLPPVPSASCLSFSVFQCASLVEITEGEGVGEEPNYTTARNPGLLLFDQYSLPLVIRRHQIMHLEKLGSYLQ